MKRILLGTAVLAMALAPLAGNAATVADTECSGSHYDEKGNPTLTGSCTATFELDGSAVKLSQLGTHANFHSPGVTGTLVLKWIDALGVTIAAFDCVGAGNALGLTDVARNCTEKQPVAASYAAGTQTIVVEATSQRLRGGTYHGRLVFVTPDEPI